MTATERRASASLASIFALRMLGLFLVLPVFALEAAKYPGGDDPARVGLAMGIYGLTQGLLQIPFGIASDWWGRKRVIISGLVIFALGSLIAAWAPDLNWLVAGRALQGAGAISAAVTALLADSTRDEVRTKAMALVGGSIALMFALSLVVAPLLASYIGLHGLFALTGALALAGIAVVVWWVPPEPVEHANRPRGSVLEVLKDPALLRLDFGVFILHAVQLAMWVAIPALLVGAGLDKASHWQVYLPAVLASFLVMGAVLFPLERRGYLRAVFLGAVGLIFVVQLGLLWVAPRSRRRTAWQGWAPCCSCFSAVSTCSKPPSPAWPPAWRPPMRAARRWASTTPCSRWAFSPAARPAAGSPRRTAPRGFLWCAAA
jgi:MFS family permease